MILNGSVATPCAVDERVNPASIIALPSSRARFPIIVFPPSSGNWLRRRPTDRPVPHPFAFLWRKGGMCIIQPPSRFPFNRFGSALCLQPHHRLAFNCHNMSFTECPRAEARPRPVFGCFAKSSFHWIAVNVTKLSDESRVVPNVVIEVACLPKRRPSGRSPILLSGLDRHLCLQHLNQFGQTIVVRLAG